MDMFMPMPTDYAPLTFKTRQDNRTGRDERSKTVGGEDKDKQSTSKQTPTGRYRTFSGKSKKSKSQSQLRSRSESGSRSTSRPRTGRKKTQKLTQTGDTAEESESVNSSGQTGHKNSRGNGFGMGRIESTIATSTTPAGEMGMGLNKELSAESRTGTSTSTSITSPSREGHDRVLVQVGDINLSQNPNWENKNPAPVASQLAPPISSTIKKTTFNTITTVDQSPSTVVPSIDTSNNPKPLPQIPSALVERGRTSSVGAKDVDIDPTIDNILIARAELGTGILSTSVSTSAFASSSTSTSTVATASNRLNAPSLYQYQLAANGSLSAVNVSKNPLPIPSSAYTGAGPGVGAGAGVSILPSRDIPSQRYGQVQTQAQGQKQRRLSKQHAAMVPAPSQSSSSTKSSSTSAAFRRTGSLSSTSASGVSSSHRVGVMTSSDHFPPSSHEGSSHISVGNISSTSGLVKTKISVGPKPLIIRNGRTYIHDEQLPYPLPVDLAELHRQSLRTLLLFQLFGGPIISTAFAAKPPQRVLEVGCGSGFWSMMCHRYFAQHGHHGISFTGIDIVPLCGTGPDPNSKPDKDMNWRFIQHDMRRAPWPFPDGEFDLVMVKDMASAAPGQFSQVFMDEYLRILRPGGVLEIWETDMSMRMLRPHVPATPSTPATAAPSIAEDSESESEDEDDATRLGVYVVSANTPLSAPLNQFLVEYNGWLSKALDRRYLSAVPCAMMGPMLLQEDGLIEVRSKRLAVPLSEIRWEREGVGGVVTKDGKSYIDSMKGKGKASDAKAGKGGKTLTAVQAAIRRTALETSVGLIQALEPMLRDISGKSQDEWDGWTGKMMNDLLKDGGTSWGECLEIGAWSARKKK